MIFRSIIILYIIIEFLFPCIGCVFLSNMLQCYLPTSLLVLLNITAYVAQHHCLCLMSFHVVFVICA